MNYWRWVALPILVATGVGARAGDYDYRSSFRYPDVQITVDFGTDVGHAETIPFKNHGLVKSAKKIVSPEFQGGWEMSGNRPDDPRVNWRFVKKTKTGDLYLLDVYRNERLSKEFSVLYQGSPLVAYNQDEIVVTFEHPETAKWKAL